MTIVCDEETNSERGAERREKTGQTQLIWLALILHFSDVISVSGHCETSAKPPSLLPSIREVEVLTIFI